MQGNIHEARVQLHFHHEVCVAEGVRYDGLHREAVSRALQQEAEREVRGAVVRACADRNAISKIHCKIDGVDPFAKERATVGTVEMRTITVDGDCLFNGLMSRGQFPSVSGVLP